MDSPLGPQPSASASSATSARKRDKYIKGPGREFADRLASLPAAAALRRAYSRRPRLTSSVLLGAAMVALMTAFSTGSGLGMRQWVALAGATLATAWLAVWIVFQEEDEASG